MTLDEQLMQEFGYIPANGEKWTIYEHQLIVAHPDRQPRIYTKGCNGVYELLEPWKGQ